MELEYQDNGQIFDYDKFREIYTETDNKPLTKLTGKSKNKHPDFVYYEKLNHHVKREFDPPGLNMHILKEFECNIQKLVKKHRNFPKILQNCLEPKEVETFVAGEDEKSEKISVIPIFLISRKNAIEKENKNKINKKLKDDEFSILDSETTKQSISEISNLFPMLNQDNVENFENIIELEKSEDLLEKSENLFEKLIEDCYTFKSPDGVVQRLKKIEEMEEPKMEIDKVENKRTLIRKRLRKINKEVKVLNVNKHCESKVSEEKIKEKMKEKKEKKEEKIYDKKSKKMKLQCEFSGLPEFNVELEKSIFIVNKRYFLDPLTNMLI